jgi:hypothetical protein
VCYKRRYRLLKYWYVFSLFELHLMYQSFANTVLFCRKALNQLLSLPESVRIDWKPDKIVLTALLIAFTIFSIIFWCENKTFTFAQQCEKPNMQKAKSPNLPEWIKILVTKDWCSANVHILIFHVSFKHLIETLFIRTVSGFSHFGYCYVLIELQIISYLETIFLSI